jgi:uncharacterized protein (TIGR02145 family)
MKKKNSILISKVVAIVAILLLIPACDDFQNAGTVTDKDGNVYQTVVIGTQTWMRENLKTTKFNDGTEIPLVTDASQWIPMKTPAYCWYENDIKNKKTYGALYNWFTVNTGKLAPEGWHVASEAEWNTLIGYLAANPGKSYNSACALAGTKYWEDASADVDAVGDQSANNNSSGFSAVPGGYRDDFNGINYTFKEMGRVAMWWCSDDIGYENVFAKCSSLSYRNTGIPAVMSNYSRYGYSVRCIKD